MPNFDGTGPAGAGAMSGLGRGLCGNGQGRGFGGGAGAAGFGRQRMRCQRFAGMGGFGSRWLGGSIEAVEQQISRLQQYLAALKSQPGSGKQD